MANKHRPLSPNETLDLMQRAPVVHLALPPSSPQEAPALRPMHAVLLDDTLWFHGHKNPARLSEGGYASVAAHSVIARLPSFFFHAESACPATTWYESALVEGPLVQAPDLAFKARVLQAVMDKYQPEGGYVPLSDGPRYAGILNGLAVWGVRAERVSGRVKAGFHLQPEALRALLGRLWARGLPEDVYAIQRIRRWNPELPDPDFLRGPARLNLCPDEPHAAQAAALLAPTYWNQGLSLERIHRAQRQSTAWIVAEQDGAVVGSARALSDGAKCAWIYDVVVAEPWRGQGLGMALLRVLLDHPALRGAKRVMLGTRDAMDFYKKLGFVPRDQLPPRPYSTVDMVWDRG